MGHHIIALVVPGPCDASAIRALDLVPIQLSPGLMMFHINHYYSTYWQSIRGANDMLDLPPDFPCIFPQEGVLVSLVAELTVNPRPTFALIMTDYFGGMGDQWACVFQGSRRISTDTSINAALRLLGVTRRPGLDEFDTVGLGSHRSSLDYLMRYAELCAERDL